MGTMARSGVFFWLLTYSVIHLSVIIIKIRESSEPEFIPKLWSLLFPVFGFISMCFGTFLILWYEPEIAILGKVILWALTVVLVFSIIWVKVKSKR